VQAPGSYKLQVQTDDRFVLHVEGKALPMQQQAAAGTWQADVALITAGETSTHAILHSSAAPTGARHTCATLEVLAAP
jgi:hypothetical protein